MPSIDRIAKTINGPNEVKHISQEKLEQLQDIRWGQLKAQDQIALRRTAGFVQALLDNDTHPHGWVITNGDDTKCRAIDTSSEYVGGNAVTWTDSIDKALQFARRRDAEAFCEDDDAAWHIRRVIEVRAMWAKTQGAPVASTATPVGVSEETGGIVLEGAVPALPAPLLGVDERSPQHLLQLFRAFVLSNVTQWRMGSGDHHHPIWQDVAVELDAHDRNYEASDGPDWAFIQPTNREPYQALVEAYADTINEATETGYTP